METKKITRATIKSFIKRESEANQLYIKVTASFDGMVDGIMPNKDAHFAMITAPSKVDENNLGIIGAHFVGEGRDYFTEYADSCFIGYTIDNCCGSFILAFPRR